MDLAEIAPTTLLSAERRTFDEHAARTDCLLEREVPVETPINIIYDAVPFAVMMATPNDLEDFAFGFSLTEGVIERASHIRRVDVTPHARGVSLHVSLVAGHAPRAISRERNTVGRTGCGLCGIDTIDAIPMATPRARPRQVVHLSAVRSALAALEASQHLNERTHAVHGAAWCAADGAIVALREDVGRHNALDKVLGALIRQRHEANDGFLVITSRCSFEMVEKAAVYGASTIVAISAPTSLAVERAAVHDMTLIAVARRDSALVFHGADSVVRDVPRRSSTGVTAASGQ